MTFAPNATRAQSSSIEIARFNRAVLFAAAIAAATLTGTLRAQELPVLGVTGAHDPSRITKEGNNYFYYVTGQGIVSRKSTDGITWTNSTSVFSTQPAWTTTAVPGFTGFFWAPDVVFQNNEYYMYYAVSTFGSRVSGIGLAISPTLNPSDPNYGWVDQGPVVQSGNPGNTATWNAIDPSILQDTTSGNLYMSFGSFSTGIYLAQLDPSTGKIKAGTTQTQLASNKSGVKDFYGNTDLYANGVEASYLMQHDGYYYLFDNWGGCCSGVSSSYNIRVGRSTSVNGPFLDQNGVSMKNGGGSLFMGNDGNQIGPGQLSFYQNGAQDEFGYHYYDGNVNGAPTEGLRDLFWTASDWPTIAAVNPNWNGNANGNWSAPANWADAVWNTGLIPDGVGTIANFVTTSAGQHTVALDGGPKTVATLNLNSGAAFTIGTAGGNGLILDTGSTNTVNINVQLGSHTINAPITARQSLGVNISYANNTLTLGAVSGSTLNKYGLGMLSLSGANIYTGNLFVRRGTLDVTGPVSVTSFSSIGVGANDLGTLNVRLSGSYTAGGDLNIGDSGDANTAATGTLNLSGNGQVTVGAGGGFYVGSGFFSGVKANGTVFQSGGTLTANGTADGGFTLGGRTSKLAIGVYNLSGAAVVNANTNAWIGGFGSGTMNQNGGTFAATANVAIGRQTNSTGTWNISSGALNQTTPGDFLTVGYLGAGTLNVSGTAQVTLASALRVGFSSSSNGIVNLNGGTLTAPQITHSAGSGTFNFNGGTLKAAASSTTFMQGLTSAKVLAGGAIVDDGGFAVTIAQPLLSGVASDGGLTKNGAGSLSLTGVNTYTGPTTVNNGALLLSTPGALPANTALMLAAGASVQAAAHGANPKTLLQLSSLSLPGTTDDWSATLDLANNDAIIHNGDINQIANQIKQSFNGGNWLGAAGITSSTAALLSSPKTALGYGSLTGAFDGQSVTSTDVLLDYTLAGDSNLDSSVNFNDLLSVAQNYNSTSATWQTGDFNYDGNTNFSDLLSLAQNYNQSLSALQLSALSAAAGPSFSAAWTQAESQVAIPEPTALLIPIAGFVLASRRRRRA